jgi:hypothetical protein
MRGDIVKIFKSRYIIETDNDEGFTGLAIDVSYILRYRIENKTIMHNINILNIRESEEHLLDEDSLFYVLSYNHYINGINREFYTYEKTTLARIVNEDISIVEMALDDLQKEIDYFINE